MHTVQKAIIAVTNITIVVTINTTITAVTAAALVPTSAHGSEKTCKAVKKNPLA